MPEPEESLVRRITEIANRIHALTIAANPSYIMVADENVRRVRGGSFYHHEDLTGIRSADAVHVGIHTPEIVYACGPNLGFRLVLGAGACTTEES